MKKSKCPEQIDLLPYTGNWIFLVSSVAALAGSASAFLPFALDWATATRVTYSWLIWLLPVAGFMVGWLYLRFDQHVEAGNNLLIDEIHDSKKIIPLRMAPLVLGGTVVSYLFGASVGREGTAVQMGGALANQLTHLFKLKHEDRRIILMAGISAGFASVFGTLLAGIGFVAVFAGAANTPIACVVSYLFSRHTGIYRSQRIGHAKHRHAPEGIKLSELPAYRKEQLQRTAAEQAES